MNPPAPLMPAASSNTIPNFPYWLTRLCFQRAFGFIYLTVFWGTAHQFKFLIGERGLQPTDLFLDRIHFWASPGLFWLGSSDAFMGAVAWAGVLLSVATVTGLSERFGMFISILVWSLLWLFHLSFVNVGQTFYSFGWEIMTLEVGFLAIFLGSRDTRPPAVVIWLLRWVLFRLMFGAGLIKLRGDECWRNLTCMDYHYQTQPIPNPLSWYFHHLPLWFHKIEVLFTHFVEIIVPWGILSRWRRPRIIAGILTVIFQTALILSGNLSWLNYLTLVVAIACFDDTFFKKFIPLRPEPAEMPPMSLFRKTAIGALAALVGFLSIGPVTNLVSPRQAMNRSFDPLHLVNTYGAFGSVTKERDEIILEGTDEATVGSATRWKEYEFKAKPGDTTRMPRVVSPYQMRLDWLMWFAAMGSWRQYPWVLGLTGRLLQNDPEALKHMAGNPFPDSPPRYIRATLYRYRFTTAEEKKQSSEWWVREPVGTYFPPLSLDNPSFRQILQMIGWRE